jgi:hypothetical protein
MRPSTTRRGVRWSNSRVLTLPFVIGRLQLPDDRVDGRSIGSELRITAVIGQVADESARLGAQAVRRDNDVPALGVVMEEPFAASRTCVPVHRHLHQERGALRLR